MYDVQLNQHRSKDKSPLYTSTKDGRKIKNHQFLPSPLPHAHRRPVCITTHSLAKCTLYNNIYIYIFSPNIYIFAPPTPAISSLLLEASEGDYSEGEDEDAVRALDCRVRYACGCVCGCGCVERARPVEDGVEVGGGPEAVGGVAGR